MSTSTAYVVEGMTCSHCVRAVRDEVALLPGVLGVDVDLASGTLTIDSSGPVAPDAVRDAVEEAGYGLAPR
jgi:copper chaperone CopZ